MFLCLSCCILSFIFLCRVSFTLLFLYSYCSFFFFFKQKTAYEMRISDWSSDVCSSDLTDCSDTDATALSAVGNGMMIRDTSAQDRLVEVKPNRKRQLILLGVGVLVLGLLAWLAPGIGRLFSASASVSSSRLAFATVERGAFVRDIAADGKVVAAVSPTLYATSGGAVTLKVHAGDTVKIGQVMATIVSPELTNKLAQEQSNADAMEVDYKRAQIRSEERRVGKEGVSTCRSGWLQED